MKLRTVLICTALSLASCRGGIEASYDALPPVGAEIPDFRFPLLDGEPVSSASLRGAPVLVALWSSDCSASREALRALDEFHAAGAGGGRVIILADDRDEAHLRAYLERAGAHLPVALAAGSMKKTFARPSRLPWKRGFGLPSFLLLDPQGRIVARQVGIELAPEDRLHYLRDEIKKLMEAATSGMSTESGRPNTGT